MVDDVPLFSIGGLHPMLDVTCEQTAFVNVNNAGRVFVISLLSR